MMKMHVLSGGRLRMRKSVFLPDAPREQTIDLPVSCFFIRHGQGNVLFDTGCHPSVAQDAAARWGGLAKLITPIFDTKENVIEGLRCLGVAPDDVDVVVCSHLHPDHCGCNEFFRKATVVCHAKEMAAVRAENAEQAGYVAADWDHPQRFDLIEAERDLFGDDRVVLVPLPGHTPGVIGALVNLDRSGAFLLASDSLNLRENLDRDVIPRNTWNRDVAAKTFDEIRRIERGGAMVICGHDDAQWASLRKGADAYD